MFKIGEKIIALISQTDEEQQIFECYCGQEHPHRGKWWSHSKKFAKIDESSLEEAIEQENYELASILRDNLKQLK
jgi:protein-arginine kinase activator protein McsA